MENIIQVKNVSKQFKEKLAVDNVSFTVPKGEVFGLLGTNGAGKSTIIKMLTGQLYPTSGEIAVANVEPVKNIKKLATKIGVVTEALSVYQDATVEDNLRFFGKLYNVSDKRFDEVIDMVGLKEYSKTKVKKLSKGYKQRVLIARAVLHDPEILFLDEPTSGLDVNIALELRELIRQFSMKEKTIILTTHDLTEAEELCNDILILKEGKVVIHNTLQQIHDRRKEGFVIVETKHGKIKLGYDELNKIANIAPSDIISINSNTTTLRDVFISQT